jgi:hypothetical protein
MLMRGVVIPIALALAVMGTSSALADETQRQERMRPVPAGFVLTEAHIARLKSALNLNAVQARHWPGVEAALRDFIRGQGVQPRSTPGFWRYAGVYSAHAVNVSRLLSAAAPLIETLDDAQKREVIKLARAIGLRAIPASF